MSMLNVEKTLLGFRYTKWHDCPASAVSNGRTRAVVHTFGDPENVIYWYAWPMDGGKFKFTGGYLNGLQWQVNPATPPVVNGQQWKTSLKGFLEDTGFHFHRFVKSASENTFFPEGLEIELYEYCPNGVEPQFLPYFEFVNKHAPYFEYLPETNSYSPWGQGPAPAAIGVRLLKELYPLMPDKDTYKNRIKSLADYLLSIQCTDATKNWYGGFISHTSSAYYYSIDAAFGGEAFLDAYQLLNDSAYLTAAERCASFLRHMQTRHLAGLVDQYYGGFCEYVRSDNGQYYTGMFVKLLLALPFLKRLYNITGNSLYNTMASDARTFLVQGLTTDYEYYHPLPSGDNSWHRMYGSGGQYTDIYADSYAYALRGLYEYEGLTLTVQNVYNRIKGIGGGVQYPDYDPNIAWAGYIDVVNNKPDCAYYDMVIAGLLASIKMEYDRAALATSFNKLVEWGKKSFYWGVNYDGTPNAAAKQHTITCAGLGWGFAQLDLGLSKDLMILLFDFKNVGASQISFTFGVYSDDYSTYAGTEKYVHPDYSALVKSDGKTVIWGSDTAPQDCYMDGAWRTANYSNAVPNNNWLRWSITLNAGAEKLFAFIVSYADSELVAVSSYTVVKAWNFGETLQKELRFWKEWLSEGEAYTSGIYEIDQLARVNLCLIKSFMSWDNYALPGSLSDGYPWSHWPVDAWTCYYSLTLWGHLTEAKNYFGTFIKKVTEYIKANSLNLYKSIHICNLVDYTTTQSNYTSEACFLLPIVAVETWKKDKSDTTFRDNIWNWIQTFMDELDGDLITYGEWKDHFDHKNIYASFESWLFVIPHEMYGNTMMFVMPVNALLARCYEKAAELAEDKGDTTKASTWNARASTIRGKFYDFWTLNRRASYHYWGDVTGYGQSEGWPSWDNMKHNRLPDKPIFRLSWLADIKDDTMREAVRLYYDNYLAYYSGLVGAEPSDNWMYGKTERRSSYGVQTGFDMHLWDIFLAATGLGFDDIIEDFLLGIKAKYSPTRNGLFDEWPNYDVGAGTGYHMPRTMGLFLLGFAFFADRLDPVPVKKFQLQLHANGKEVTILKETGTSTDQLGNVIPSFEPTYKAKAIVEAFKANEQVVLAGVASIDDRRVFFNVFTPVEAADRIRINDVDYAVQTVEEHYYKNRVVKKEAFAKRVVE